MKTRKKHALIIGALCLSFTVFAWGNTAYIFSKALLAQYLIADAWEESLLTGKNQRPWSWADTWPVARLQSAGYSKDLFVLAGASGTSLAFGPGHLDGSALPGELGAIVIGGHRDTHLAFMQNLQAGDELTLQNINGHWFSYAVSDIQINDIRTDKLQAASHASELILVTCYPFDAIVPGGPLRYVVRAKLQ